MLLIRRHLLVPTAALAILTTAVQRTLRWHLRSVLLSPVAWGLLRPRPMPRVSHPARHHPAHLLTIRVGGAGTHHSRILIALLSCELSLLLGICGLCSALRLLVLLPRPLVDSLRNRMAANACLHLCPLTLPGIDSADEPRLGLRCRLVPTESDQRATSNPSHVFLLTGRQVRRQLATRESGSGALTERAAILKQVSRVVTRVAGVTASWAFIRRYG
jgi:hypothetical protein